MTPASIGQPTLAFPEQASRALADLRAAMIDMFSEVPGGIRKSYDVNKLLGVDARLSWQIFRLTGPGEALSLGAHVPAPATMRRLLAAASKHGFSAPRVQSVRNAFEAFERLVEDHAGDRSCFDTMTRAAADDEMSQQTDFAHRKSLFKGHRHFLGVELETYAHTIINYPTTEPGMVDVGSVRTRLGMRRLRSESEMIVDGTKLWKGASDSTEFAFFDPRSPQPSEAGLMREFCTDPLPALKFRQDSTGERITSLAGETVGKKAQVDLVLANVWRNVELLSPDAQGRQGFSSHIYALCPTTHFYVNILIHRSIAGMLQPSVEVYGFAPLLGDVDEIKRKQPRIDFREKFVQVPGGLKSGQIREVPQFLPMIDRFCEQMNWNTDDFELFRLYIAYPIVGSLISARFNVV